MPTAENARSEMDRILNDQIVRTICEFEADPKQAKYRNGWIVDWEDGNRRGFELPDAHLSNAKLARADFTGAVLDRANLRGADLSNAKLTRTSLIGADLTDANLENADLSGANLENAIGLPDRP